MGKGKTLLQFLFPEWQIVQAGKTFGPFSKDKRLKETIEVNDSKEEALSAKPLRIEEQALEQVKVTEAPPPIQQLTQEMEAVREVEKSNRDQMDVLSKENDMGEPDFNQVMEQLKERCQQELSIELNWDYNFEQHIQQEFEKKGIGLEKYLTTHILEPVELYKSSHELRAGHFVYLTLIQNRLAFQSSGETIFLDGDKEMDQGEQK